MLMQMRYDKLTYNLLGVCMENYVIMFAKMCDLVVAILQ